MPNTWIKTNLSGLVDQRLDKIVTGKNPQLPYVGLEHIAQGEPRLLGTAPSKSSTSNNSVFSPGDILFGKLRPNLRKSVQVDFQGYCSTDIIVLTAKEGVHPSFAARILQWDVVFREAVRTAEGTKMPRTSWAKLGQFEVHLPPAAEQRRIAEILDTIDDAIQQTDAVIAKLKQVKAGLLHDLLTRGINEHGQIRDPHTVTDQFRDTAIGSFPRVWQVTPLELFLTGIDAGQSPDCPDRPAATGEWGVLKVSAIRPDGLRAQENKVVEQRSLQNPNLEIRERDLLISRANTYELVGLTCIVRSPPRRLMLSDKTLRLNVDLRIVLPELLQYLLQMPYLRSQIEISSTGTSGSMKNISQVSIRALIVPVPGLDEQIRIVSLLEAQDADIRAETDYMAKLKQLRMGLLDDLLTGRIRVSLANEGAL